MQVRTPEMKDQMVAASRHDPRTYPNLYEDPERVAPDITRAELAKYKKDVQKEVLILVNEMKGAFRPVKIEEEELWKEFISNFRPDCRDLWRECLTYK